MTSTPTKYPTLSPAFAVNDAVRALEFYRDAFGAAELFRLVDPESGKIGHAEMSVGDSVFMVSDEYPAFNKTPATLGGTSVRLSLIVGNVDAIVARAVAAGATLQRPPTDQFYGFRSASLLDPFGHEWIVQHEIERVTPAEMQRRWDAMRKVY
ncbi:MAG TPA: VOC family protein [Verrucomicrobiota bacterium]|nr:glyxoylase [Verrucomicrobiales bacterium]HRI15311.1 VOC family protein [Verrucomicrobiota bacterium]